MHSHKKIMLSAIAASFIVANSAYAISIYNDNRLSNSGSDKSHYTYLFSDKDVVKTQLGSSKLNLVNGDKINHLTIKSNEKDASLRFVGLNGIFSTIGGSGYLDKGYSFDLTAKNVIFISPSAKIQDEMSRSAGINVANGHSTITADHVVFDHGFINLVNGSYFNNGHKKDVYNGSLTINGDLILNNSEVSSTVYTQGASSFYVNGKVTAKDTDFAIGVEDLSRATPYGYYFMTASKGFENGYDNKKTFTDVTSGNTADMTWNHRLVNISADLMRTDLAENTGTFTEADFANVFSNQDLDRLWDFNLVQSGNNLYINGNLDDRIYRNGKIDFNELNSAVKAIIADKINSLLKLSNNYGSNPLNGANGIFDTKKHEVAIALNTQKNEVEIIEGRLETLNKNATANKVEIDRLTKTLQDQRKILAELQNRFNEYTALIENVQNQIAILAPKLNENYRIEADQKGRIFASLAGSEVGGKIIGATDYILGSGKAVRDVEKAANSNAGNSALNTPIGAINIANDMAISNRLAKFSNPYSTMIAGESFAAGNGTASDSSFAYGSRSYANNVWANAIGGANIIDGNSGALYGVSIGYDRLLGENTILGAYLTYANSDLKTDLVKQESDNLQVGLYSRTLHGNHEFDFKGYAQFGWTDQDRQIVDSINSSDFTRKFLGASGTYGYVFDVGHDFYIKPLAGLNLYYSFTPDYTESGTYAQHVRSQSNFDASLEAGAEFRKYLSKESYIYAIPKIEQYIVTSGDDYTARFVGSPVSFTVDGSDSKKTFGALILGGDINFANQWAFTFSAGVKQLLSGKVDDQDETYVSGNIGLKYQF
ncbi:autotransporter domain-containing protein [Campylobacter estrildidarum]|uniref:Autotransporter domain-containing protein n=2 Tax=Campylobacter estrildidarum TaxID=2510189 RepID=A0A4U7BKF4_9BACT|nr:autotransporter domain-containing protein [Campylobacter estrildidarum]